MGHHLFHRSLYRNFVSVVLRRAVTGAALVAGWVTLLAGSAAAVNVSNYSWLQLPAANVTTVLGSTNNVTGSGYGEPADFRWGDHTWLPGFAMTNSATQMYYAGVRLDQSRPIDNVRLQMYTASLTLSRYYIDASNDGSSWSNIAVQTGATPVSSSIVNVPVTPGTYQYVRVRFEPGDYTAGGYGGPGLTLLEPSGSGTVTPDKVNWANGPNFGTTITNNGNVMVNPLGLATYNGTAYNSGSLQDQGGIANWTGSVGNWPAGEYTQIDLGTARLLNSATAAWDTSYTGSGFNLQYSVDGTSFFPVPNPQSPTQFANGTANGATRVLFDPTIARYIRMSNAVQLAGGYTLMNQMLLHGPTDGVLATVPAANNTIGTPFRVLPETVNLTGAVELKNVGTLGSSIAIFDYNITGPDALQFDLTNFAPTILSSGGSVLFNLEFMSLASQNYNAVLTFSTSVGDIVFNLQANMVPEPSTFTLFGLGLLGLAVHRRRRRVVRSSVAGALAHGSELGIGSGTNRTLECQRQIH